MTVMRLSARLVDFLARGLSIHIGACDAQGTPRLTRALAVRAEADGHMAALVPAVPGASLLAAIAQTQRLSMVMCQPTTNLAVQVRGQQAEVSPAELSRWPELARNHEDFLREIHPFGFSREFTAAWFEVPQASMAQVRFVPTGAWDQTPGPGAGTAVELYA